MISTSGDCDSKPVPHAAPDLPPLDSIHGHNAPPPASLASATDHAGTKNVHKLQSPTHSQSTTVAGDNLAAMGKARSDQKVDTPSLPSSTSCGLADNSRSPSAPGDPCPFPAPSPPDIIFSPQINVPLFYVHNILPNRIHPPHPFSYLSPPHS